MHANTHTQERERERNRDRERQKEKEQLEEVKIRSATSQDTFRDWNSVKGRTEKVHSVPGL